MPNDVPPESRNRAELMLSFAERAAENGEHFFYVRIPASVGPHERGTRYEDPLQQAHTATELGEVTGGGSQLGEDGSIAYCGLEVVAADHAMGLALVRKVMRRVGAPSNTVIEEYLPSFSEHAL